MRCFFHYFFLILLQGILAQEQVVSGEVINRQSGQVIPGAIVQIEGTLDQIITDSEGRFQWVIPFIGTKILVIKARDFVPRRIPLDDNQIKLELGIVYLERDFSKEMADHLSTLSEADLDEAEDVIPNTGLLRATRDIFLNRAAFDFGQVFFRVRGYDSRNGKVLINGIAMNGLFDGRPQWNLWGGLNDITRNQEFTYGLEASNYAFGGLLGTTNIDTRPSGLRPGLRISSSASNRTYSGRLMATYSSGVQKNKMVCAFSISGRWANQGYIDGTLYDAYSVFGGFEYRYSKYSSLYFTAILASNRRGRSAAITQEVFQMAGHRYNPYWGYQNGALRNSRVRKIQHPVLMLNHLYQADKLYINTGIAYRFGQHAKSRLGYYNAPNPDPTYYRYLPSFYLNSSIGANFLSAQKAREGFLRHPQLNWEQVYLANTNFGSKQKAAYVLYDDVVEDTSVTLNGVANLKAGDHCNVALGLRYTALVSRNNARIRDLLGAEYHEDIDPFSNTLNDVNGPREKHEGDIINYDYRLTAGVVEAFTQIKLSGNTWDAFIAAIYSKSTYNREGLFMNERFPDHSLGKRESIEFSNIGIKGGLTCQVTGRHWIKANAAILTRAPFLQNVFINPREHHEVVPGLQNEKLSSADLNYYMRLPDLTGRLTGFYSRFQNGTNVNFFFVDAGLGSDFVQEAITSLDRLNMGIELGMSYKVSPTVKLTAVSAIYKQLYASDPFVRINFDTAGDAEDLIAAEGFKELGVASIKDYKLAHGPQKAVSFGVEYRDPKYWWVGVTANYLANNYPNLATITRTQSFYLDPEEGQPFKDATEQNVNGLLKQRSLDTVYLLNLVGGKSWLLGGKYISVFASVNNVFDRIFRTGGYEQSRNGNYGQLARDNLSGTPSFAPKYWYGYGRTYFLNIAVSF